MILLLILVLIVLTIIYTFLRLDKDNHVKENFESSKKKRKKIKPAKIEMEMSNKRNFIENILAYPNKQRYCPNLYNSRAKVWSRLPPKYGKGLFIKYNCTMCYYKIFRNIICFKNQGKYKICKMKNTDLDNLEKYFEEHKNKLDFVYKRSEFEKYIGKHVLKFKYEGVYYPIQILKTKKDMDYKDIIDDDTYRTDFKCKKLKKKKVEKKEKKSESDIDNDQSDIDNDQSDKSDESNDKGKKKEDGIFSFFDLL